MSLIRFVYPEWILLLYLHSSNLNPSSLNKSNVPMKHEGLQMSITEKDWLIQHGEQISNHLVVFNWYIIIYINIYYTTCSTFMGCWTHQVCFLWKLWNTNVIIQMQGMQLSFLNALMQICVPLMTAQKDHCELLLNKWLPSMPTLTNMRQSNGCGRCEKSRLVQMRLPACFASLMNHSH